MRKNALGNAIDAAMRLLMGISGAMFVAGTLLTFVNVVMRKVFNHPWVGTEELDGIMLVILVFLPLAYLEWTNRHLTVSILYDLFPMQLKFWCRKLQHLVILGIAVYITAATWDVVIRNFEAGNKSASLGIPLYICYLILFVGFALTALTKLFQIFMSENNGDGHAH